MNKKRCAVVALLVGGFLFMFMLVLGGISVYLIRQNLEEKRARNTAPSVIVHSPSQGEAFPEGSPILANVTAAGVNPIARLELWLDGELVETQTPETAIGIENLSFQALFDLLVEEGIHILYWRAVDSNGLVGQSQPVSVEIVPIPQDAEPVAGEVPLPDAPDEAGPEPGEPPTAAAPDQAGDQPQAPGEAKKPAPGGAGAGPSKLPPKGSTSKKPDLPPDVKILEVTGIAIDVRSLISSLFINIPEAPSGLQAGFEDCSIRLVWFDNADNETGYDVWIQRLGGPPQRIATQQAAAGIGPVTYEFRAPPFGIYSVWVEAVNGAFSQPSEIKGVAVNDEDCSQTALAAMLEIEGLDMSVLGNHDQVHCYLSLEGFPFQRIPEQEGQSIQVLGMAGDIKPHWGGENRILLPIPADEEVSLEGKCLTIVGDEAVELGEFQANVPKEQWDGRRLEVKGDSQFTIGYRIRPHGFTIAQGVYKFTDTSIPQPKNLSTKVDSSPDPIENARLGRTPELHWGWPGTPNSIKGFNVLLDGEFFRWAAPEYNWTTILLPTSCGGVYDLQVAAVNGDATSVPSPILHYEQPPCEIYAEVTFDSFTFTWIDDPRLEASALAGCDVAELFFTIEAEKLIRYFGNENFTFSKSCGTHIFKGFQQFGGYPPSGSVNTFYIPIDPAHTQFWVSARFKDYDEGTFIWGGDEDELCYSRRNIQFPYDQWADVDVTYTDPCPFQVDFWPLDYFDARGSVTVRVRGVSGPAGP